MLPITQHHPMPTNEFEHPRVGTVWAARQQRFVTVWSTSRSVAEVMKRLHISYRTATARATRLRSHGVPLKKFPTGPKPKPKSKPKPRPRKPHRTASEFAAIWNSSASHVEAAKRMRITPRSASTMASAHRKAGVALKRYDRVLVEESEVRVFVAAWNASDTVPEAAERLGIPLALVRSRAVLLRGRGVVLKHLLRPAIAKTRRSWQRIATLWNASSSVAEAAVLLKLSRRVICLRASRLRERGFTLKHFPPGPRSAKATSRRGK
jgi:hypothetical protein